MSERTFRVAISALLAGALVLAGIVVITLVPGRPQAPDRSQAPASGSPVETGGAVGPTGAPTSTSPEAATPSATPAPVFGTVGVAGVGEIAQGGSSARTLVLEFTELSEAAIPDAPGSLRVTLADHAGDGSTVAFVGVPVVDAPDSLGAIAAVVGPNVLEIRIVASDPANVEPIRIAGLGISASAKAAPGAIGAQLGQFTGSLAGGAASGVLSSPGDVIVGQ